MRDVMIYDLADPVNRRTIYADSGPSRSRRTSATSS